MMGIKTCICNIDYLYVYLLKHVKTRKRDCDWAMIGYHQFLGIRVRHFMRRTRTLPFDAMVSSSRTWILVDWYGSSMALTSLGLYRNGVYSKSTPSLCHLLVASRKIFDKCWIFQQAMESMELIFGGRCKALTRLKVPVSRRLPRIILLQKLATQEMYI